MKKNSENKETSDENEDNPLVVTPFKTSKNKVRCRNHHVAHIVPSHPFRLILSGQSGSGKTNCLIKMLTEKKMYKSYFDVIFLISPTAGVLDDSFDFLEKNKGKTIVHVINELDPDTIEDIMNTNKKNIEENEVHKAPRILIVYDDCISNVKFMNTKSFRHSFIASRHYNASVIICTQRYNSVPRVCRLQANAVIYFKGSNSESTILAEEYCPANYTKKEMLAIIYHATELPYSFLFINMAADHKQRYRCNFDKILELQK